ncbi:MAG: hypothetical protein AABX89_00090 [Candidatus Thermoplasmatota archaeon]
MHRITLRIEASSAEEARHLVASLAPENGTFLTARVEGAFIVLDAEATTALGLLRTVEDALQCLHAAGLRA